MEVYSAQEKHSSGQHQSCWTDVHFFTECEALSGPIQTDVLVVGAGISGLTVAYNLIRQGWNVVVAEAREIGSGETGRTTAHISNALDDRYEEIEQFHGAEGARYAAESHTAAIQLIADIVDTEGIACDFQFVDGYLFCHPSDDVSTLESEHQAAIRAGIATAFTSSAPGLSDTFGPFLKFPSQAQFHPLKYLNGLARAIKRKGGEIFANSRAESIKEGKALINGHQVLAEHIVVATNSPINNTLSIHSKQFPFRSYVVAALIEKSSIPAALWWDTGNMDSKWYIKPYHYTRTAPFDSTSDLLIVGGADHKVGQSEKEGVREEERYAELEAWLKLHFPKAGSIIYRWSGQVFEPLDSMGFIGRNPGQERVYIVTGDSGNGITHGSVAGLLIPDLIAGKPNSWSLLYDPARLKPSLTSDFLHQNLDTVAQYADFFTQGDLSDPERLTPGEGAIIRKGLKKLAVYRTEEGELCVHNAICPHLGCIVKWNADEKSFDCPCHGSRFSVRGKVLSGPAISDLQKEKLKET